MFGSYTDKKEQDAISTLLSFSCQLNSRGVSSPSPSNCSMSSADGDSGISSCGEDSLDIPASGGIMKKLGHKQIMRSIRLSRSPESTPKSPGRLQSTQEFDISTETTVMTTSVCIVMIFFFLGRRNSLNLQYYFMNQLFTDIFHVSFR